MAGLLVLALLAAVGVLVYFLRPEEAALESNLENPQGGITMNTVTFSVADLALAIASSPDTQTVSWVRLLDLSNGQVVGEVQAGYNPMAGFAQVQSRAVSLRREG